MSEVSDFRLVGASRVVRRPKQLREEGGAREEEPPDSLSGFRKCVFMLD